MEKSSINVISTFDTYYKPLGRIDMHNHTFFHYIYVYDGCGEIVVDNIKAKLTEGSIYLIRPVTMHEFAAGEKGMSTIEVKFDIGESTFFSKMCSLPISLDIKNTDAYTILKKMANEAEGADKYAKSMEQILFHELALTLLRANDNLNPDGQGTDTSDKFAQIIGYINQNLQEQLSLKTLADIAYMDSIYFLKQFKRYTGTTPMCYVKSMRINKAKNLLLHSDMNITQVSASAGFSSIHHFSNAFKKEVGLSPASFKRSNK